MPPKTLTDLPFRDPSPTMRDLVDYDYLEDLPPAAYQWLSTFTAHYYNGARDPSLSAEDQRGAWTAQNASRRDALARSVQTPHEPSTPPSWPDSDLLLALASLEPLAREIVLARVVLDVRWGTLAAKHQTTIPILKAILEDSLEQLKSLLAQ